MKKVIEAKTPYGIYHIDLDYMARLIADYWCEIDYEPKGGSQWEEGYNYVMGDHTEAIDFMIGNLNWDEIAEEKKILVDTFIEFKGDAEFWDRNPDNFRIRILSVN